MKAFPEQDHTAHINAQSFHVYENGSNKSQVYTALQAHISEHVSLMAQGEVGALIANDPVMIAKMRSDPQGAMLKSLQWLLQELVR